MCFVTALKMSLPSFCEELFWLFIFSIRGIKTQEKKSTAQRDFSEEETQTCLFQQISGLKYGCSETLKPTFYPLLPHISMMRRCQCLRFKSWPMKAAKFSQYMWSKGTRGSDKKRKTRTTYQHCSSEHVCMDLCFTPPTVCPSVQEGAETLILLQSVRLWPWGSVCCIPYLQIVLIGAAVRVLFNYWLW